MNDFSEYLIVSDFDRTLTDRQSRIPRENLAAIEFFTAHGGVFTMGTGRSVPMFRPHFQHVPCNAPLILYNGAAIYDYGTGVLSDAIWLPAGKALLTWLLDKYPDLRFEVQAVDAHLLMGEDPARIRFYEDQRVVYRTVRPEEVSEPLMKIAVFPPFRGTGVAQFFEGSREELALFDRVAGEIAAAWPDVRVDRSAPRILDLQHKTANKGAAARRLADRLGRTLVCVGDAMNDAAMLLEADLAFAPEDCDEAVKALGCCTLTRACDEGAIAGVVEALKQAGRGKETTHWVYLVRCGDGSLYCGYSTDPERRVRVHNSGKGAKYTRSRLPVELVWTEAHPTKAAALSREWHLKRLTHAEKEALLR